MRRRRGRALYAEWTKLVSLPGQLWTLAAVTGLMVGVACLAAAAQRLPDCPAGRGGCPAPDATAVVLSGVYVAQLAASALAVTLVAGEYRPRTIVVTLAAYPRRTAVLTAKAAVCTALVLGAGAVGVLGSLLAGRAVLTAHGFTASSGHPQAALSDPSLQRAALGTLLYLALVTLLGAGVAAAVRHQPLAAGAVAALLYGPFVVTQVVPMPDHVLHLVQKAAPMTAGLAVQSAVSGAGTADMGPWAGLGVLAGYAGAALLAGWAVFRFRDG